MDANCFDRLTRSLIATRSRRGVTQSLLGLVIGSAARAALVAEAGAKPCPPCKKRKKGKCKKKRPNGTACPGGTCQGGTCLNPTCSGVGLCAACTADESCVCTRTAADPRLAVCVDKEACDLASVGCENDAQCGSPSIESCVDATACEGGNTICCPRCSV